MDNIPEGYQAEFNNQYEEENERPIFSPKKVIITVIRDDETEIERDYIYQKDMDYNAEIAKIINTLETEF